MSAAPLAWGLAGLVVVIARPAGAEGPPEYEAVVTAATPLAGSGLPRERIPANIQVAGGDAIAAEHTLDLSSFLNVAVASVHVNEVAGSPLMPDLQYRGFLASPVLGAPPGLSLHLDGVRLNEPFGDTVNWDLVPTEAIRTVEVVPGSNPLYGLDTLGGSLSIETKTGFSDPGASVRLGLGSFERRLLGFGVGAHDRRFGLFAAGRLFGEEGWRRFSPSQAQNAFVAASYAEGAASADLIVLGGTTSLTGNGPAPEELLAVDRAAVFTYPDRTQNRMWMVIARGGRPVAHTIRGEGVAYLRRSRTVASSADQRDWSPCQGAPALLCATGASGAEAAILDASGRPVPFDSTYDAAINDTATDQWSYGVTAQIAVSAPLARRENHLFIGTAAGRGSSRFRAGSTVATFTPTRAALDTALVDPLSPVLVDGISTDVALFAADTWSVRPDLFLTAAGRFEATWLSLEDRLGSALTGRHVFRRFNPSAGLSYQPAPALGVYGRVSESTRAPTPVELTCASPTAPCRLPNGFVADPPLAQVVARTFEVGARGSIARGRTRVDYAAAAFRTTADDDIQFVSSGAVANQGYFANVGRTRRQGIEAIAGGRRQTGGGGAVAWSARYTYLRATFESPFVALSANHPDAVNGAIAVAAGARIPSVPAHIGKLAASWSAHSGLTIGVDLVAQSGQYLRGDEANLLPALPGYTVLGGRASQRLARALTAFVAVTNILDGRASTFGVLGNASEVLGPGYTNPRFVGPGAPRSVWLGLDLSL